MEALAVGRRHPHRGCGGVLYTTLSSAAGSGRDIQAEVVPEAALGGVWLRWAATPTITKEYLTMCKTYVVLNYAWKGNYNPTTGKMVGGGPE